MKKHLTYLGLTLLSTPFAFYKMEGPFITILPNQVLIDEEEEARPNLPNVQPNITHKILMRINMSLYSHKNFFYDDNTKYVLLLPSKINK